MGFGGLEVRMLIYLPEAIQEHPSSATASMSTGAVIVIDLLQGWLHILACFTPNPHQQKNFFYSGNAR
jgi:hypothetical protein